eukprot:UN00927
MTRGGWLTQGNHGDKSEDWHHPYKTVDNCNATLDIISHVFNNSETIPSTTTTSKSPTHDPRNHRHKPNTFQWIAMFTIVGVSMMIGCIP